ncbi:DEAD/DEAH box helicase [Deinococcus peraridilitoris]|uniref:Helicase family protein with metal-binding cysteine cluster n=1 Tax=Deinococcus peraridilitoris (strain DSM 19664 / LMG 22246 / CIP 109416 / KR-200) TaxID=937777 RepID=L0A082_DEIPD|nr:DEAD/DEAH box helicase [Deinococcus peraridilitoris]AFZ66425.1 helicase family protein with metal-binding cysteine cluster [Deinococcus peraridilitoris DSM 19664]
MTAGPFVRLELFLRDVLSSGATLLHEEGPLSARTVTASSLGWTPAVQAGFRFTDVYSHQAEVYRALQAGEHVIVTTPTASGKTGAFFPAVFERLQQRPQATALFVYPLVALGQDQRDKLEAFRAAGNFPWRIGAFQGAARPEAVLQEGVCMLTATPDKLHWSLTQPVMHRFLRNLQFLVLDEAHTYRGGFGGEVAGLVRRLLELARALGANPQVVLSTATIGNPAEFAQELCGVTPREVSESGAARHGKRFYLADHAGQPRRFWDAVMSASVHHQLKTLAFFRGRSRAARLYGTYRAHPLYAPAAHLYMAGTSDREGRLSEFRKARHGVMFATNALEAGVDIGDLEVVILDGYPGSRMAFRQMAGRAGRIAPGLVLYMPALDERGLPHPVDAFYSNAGNFRDLLTGPIEKAVIEHDNPYLAPKHAARALEEQASAGLRASSLRSRYWNLRGEGSSPFAVVELRDWEVRGVASLAGALEQPSQHYALTEKHLGAIFTLEGQGYRVVRWENHATGTAILVERHDAPHLFTRGLFTIEVRPQDSGPWMRRGPLAYRQGGVSVTRRYTGYALMRQVFGRACVKCDREPALTERTCKQCGGRIQDRMQDQKLAEHDFDEIVELPPFRTSALEVGVNASPSVAHTLKHLLHKLIPERVSCDDNDLAGAFRTGKDNYFFLYDDWLGGLGVSRRAFEQMDALLSRALDLCARECCEDGCYQCTAALRCSAPFLASGERRPTDKQATRTFLAELLGVQPETPPARPPERARREDWRAQARELLELRGLSLTEVSAQLGVPSRDLAALLSGSGPLRIRHAKFGEGALLGGSGSGERRELLVYFPGVGQKRLVLAQAPLEIVQG